MYITGQPNYLDGIEKAAIRMAGWYEDPSLLLKYGRRIVAVSHPYVVSGRDLLYFAKSYLIRVNSSRYVGTITILGRPELRVHTPIYIPYRNMIYYIEEISHSIQMGGTFTTTLKLKYGRKPWEILPEILAYGEEASPNLSGRVINKEKQDDVETKIKVRPGKKAKPEYPPSGRFTGVTP